MSDSALKISALSPYLAGKWEVFGRLTRWDGLRHYVNARGEGDILTFALSDSTGSIECVSFGGPAKRLAETLRLHKIYVVKNGRVEARKASYATADCPFQIQLRDTTTVQEAPDSYQLDEQTEATIEWIAFDELAAAITASLSLNVLGIIVAQETITTVSSRTSNATYKRGSLLLQNERLEQITITLWNDQAAAAEKLKDNTPVLVLNVHGDLHADGSLALSSLPSSSLRSAVDYEEGQELLKQYEASKETGQAQSLTTLFTGGNNMHLPLKLVNTISIAVMRGQVTDYFRVNAMVTKHPFPPNFYLRCPIVKCNAKVLKEDGRMKCSKCRTNTSNPTIGLCLVLDIQDHSGSAMISVFNETAAQFLKLSLNGAKACFEEDASLFTKLANKQRFIFHEFRVAVTENRQGTLIGKCFGIKPLSESNFIYNLNEMQTGNAVGIVLIADESTS